MCAGRGLRCCVLMSEGFALGDRYSTVETLLQYYLLLPLKQKDAHLVYLTNELSSSSTIIFTRTVADAQRLSIILRLLGFPAIPLHGQLSQSSRLGALNKFKSGGRKILVATDVAARCVVASLVKDMCLETNDTPRSYSWQRSRYSPRRPGHQLRYPHSFQGIHPSSRSYRPSRSSG